MGLLGVDLILLAGVEYDWEKTMRILEIVLFSWFGVLGFGGLLYSIMSENSAYGNAWQRKGSVPEGESEPLEIDSQYQDVGKSLVHLSILFLAQSTLMIFYGNNMTAKVELTP